MGNWANIMKERALSSSPGSRKIAQADDEFFLFNLMLRSGGGWFRSQSVVESSSACSFSSLNSRLHLLSLTLFFVCVFFSSSSVVVERLLHPSTSRLVSIMSHEHHFVNRTKKRSQSFRLVSSSTPSHYTPLTGLPPSSLLFDIRTKNSEYCPSTKRARERERRHRPKIWETRRRRLL